MAPLGAQWLEVRLKRTVSGEANSLGVSLGTGNGLSHLRFNSSIINYRFSSLSIEVAFGFALVSTPHGWSQQLGRSQPLFR